jgi:hypothetical protein
MSDEGYSTPTNQPIRPRYPATPRRRSHRAAEEDFELFDQMVARNPVPTLALPPWTPVRQNAVVQPSAPRRIVRAGPRRVMTASPPGGDGPSLPVTPVPVTPPAAPRRRARSPRSRSTEPPAKRFRYE